MDSGILRAVKADATHVSVAPHSLIRRWERFWFTEVPSESIALLRVALGVAGLVNLVGFTPVDLYWMPDGLAPLPGGGLGFRSYAITSGLSTAVGWMYFGTLALAFIAVTLGFQSNAVVLLAFLGSVLQVRWNPLPLTAGHAVLLSALFCLIWTDSGARLSFDHWRDGRTSPDHAGLQADVAGPSLQPIWPLRLIRFQLALIYFTSGMHKLFGSMWRDGSAVHYTTAHNIFGRVFHVYPLPPSLDWMLTALTYGTVLWELFFPVLLLCRPTRRFAIASGIAMHLGILMMMEVGPFTWMMLASYVAFLDPKTTRRVLALLPSAAAR